MRNLRVAIVGAGMIGEVHRRSALAAGATVIGVMASTPQRGTQVAGEWGVEHAFEDIDAVAQSDAEVVHICSPNNTHVPFAERLAEAGKHVIVEKPVGLTAQQGEHLREVAERTDRIMTVPFVYRYHPLVREIRDRYRAGELGDLNLIHGSYLQDWLLGQKATSWRVDPRVGGASRAFGDIGSHWCDLVEWVTGERFVSLTAATSIAVPQRDTAQPVETEDSALALLRSASGVLASVTVSQVAAGRKNRLWFELDGSRGSAVFDQEHPERVWLGGPEESRLISRGVSAGSAISADTRRLSFLPPGHAQGYQDCFNAFVHDSYRAVRGESVEGLPTLADGVRTSHIIDALLSSARSGQWTNIETEQP
ncbi:Gfo/Idh/MocA family oxidoreductase [Lysinibacter sp. HNR]|uniref:Gfo/Idh/MocA family protein n=1 Tax=Lysinibacter sp. HNR TaxID=3031408 RepID=UPI0024356E64|nr:Gfo/Idh/MocA family oxidoreductase [Lysinibacter sp. HNR]WGD37772.1 Gfo/Idh/MocA family oxidoreductase [Lysinibacter sp. HNR]